MSFIESMVIVIITFSLMTVLGIGPALSFLPKNIRPYTFFVAPAIGYILFCFFSIWGSGFSNISIVQSNWWALGGLLLWALYSGLLRRDEWQTMLREAKWLPVFLLCIWCGVFFPVFQQGMDLYLGTVNPDFYQSLSFQEALVQFDVPFWVHRETLDLNSAFFTYFPTGLQARFGGVVFSVLIEQLFSLPSRACLILAIMLFLSCLPLVVYFFSRLVLEFNQKTAWLSAILAIIAAPITMSFLHTFIGQNSALATIPLAISFAYLAIRERSLSLVLLTVLILSGIFWLYVMVLPYILAPLGLFVLVTCITKRWQFVKWLLLAFGCAIGVLILVHGPYLDLSIQFIKDLQSLLSLVITESNFYIDYLTEEVFFYATGLTTYPLTQSMLFSKVTLFAAPLLFIMTIFLISIYFFSLRLWSKTAPTDAVSLILCLLVTYISVWINYTFFNRYGYASFKMVSWLQFVAVPFFAWGTLFFIKKMRDPFNTRVQKVAGYAILTLLIPGYIALNVLSDLDYTLKSAGNDPYRGSLINTYGVANNPDFLALPDEIRKKVPAGRTVAVGFGDWFENFWAAYYLDKAHANARILSHELMPIDDAYLPDLISRKYVDMRGNLQPDSHRYFHGGKADYYLLPGFGSYNKDIVKNKQSAPPLWQNSTFVLYKKDDIKDLIITGPGFFRVEYINRDKISWWWPKTFRWTTDGGELFHLFPSSPGESYRIQLSVIAGLGLPDGRRTLEFWHNGKQFDEITVNGIARVTSKPYQPVNGMNRVVIRSKELAVLPKSRKGLWNLDLPRRSRQINFLFSDINVIKNPQQPTSEWKMEKVIESKSMFDLLDEFNGFNVDGWVRDKAEIVMLPPVKAKTMRLKLEIPGRLGFTFPYTVRFVLNGVVQERHFKSKGEYAVVLDLPPLSKKSLLKLEIQPEAATQLADGIEQREVLQSVRLSSIEFLKNNYLKNEGNFNL